MFLRRACQGVSPFRFQPVTSHQVPYSAGGAVAAKVASKLTPNPSDATAAEVRSRPKPSDAAETSSYSLSASAKSAPEATFSARNLPEYDVFIIGGGISGSSLLYQLSAFTDIRRIGLVERRSDYGLVASGPNNNSQTIHCGDIETNYTYEKAGVVKRCADMLRNYATKLPEDLQNKTIYKMQKMVMAVGEDECFDLETRFHKFKSLFPRMELMNKTKLRGIEPNVVRISNHRDRTDLVNAIVIRNEHSAVNYYHLTNCFLQQAQYEAAKDVNRTVDVKNNTEVVNISQNEDESYTVYTTRGNIKSRFVVVSACGYSLLFAQKLGYGLKYGCFPVAGSFYFSKTPVLNGKVYTVQNPKLPFAAVHGDPDVHAQGMTRFGPTALPMPLLERFNLSSFKDFLTVSNFDLKLITILIRMFRDPDMIRFALHNFIYELPYFGPKKFLETSRKIIPGLTSEDLVYATGYGGIRPQLIDKKKMALILGEGKIMGHNIVFNITPSPGGTTCLGNGEEDLRTICKALNAKIDEAKFKQILLEGDYPVSSS